MKSEYTYLIFFGAVIVSVSTVFVKLLQKYTYTTFYHFAETCSKSLNLFFTSGYHLTGLFIFLVVAALGLYLSLKVVFSTIKTQRRKIQFTSSQITLSSRQLKRLSQKYNFNCKNILVVKSNYPQAFALGFLSQKIVVTTSLLKALTNNELEAVILHEQYHVKSHHSAFLLLGQLISSAFFFLPFLQDVFIQMRSEFEYQADAFARQTQNTEKHVISAINKLVSPDLNKNFTPAFAVGTVEKRLAKLAGKKIITSSYTLQRSLLTISMIVVFTSLFVFPVSAHMTETELSSFGNAQCDQEMKCSVYCQNDSASSSEIKKPLMSVNQTVGY